MRLFLWVGREADPWGGMRSTMIDAECNFRAVVTIFSGLLLVVRVLKREVRAFGGCLGMHRR